MDQMVRITFEPHAQVRAMDRGTNEQEMRDTVHFGETFPAKLKRTEFRSVFVYDDFWEGNYYRNKQVHVFAAPQEQGWHVITVIIKFF
jgi:hypothetical protein